MTSNGGGKLTFSLKKKSAAAGSKATKAPPVDGFESHDPKDVGSNRLGPNEVHPDLPQAPLVIPVQKDSRQSLQEQAHQRRQDQSTTADSTTTPDAIASQEPIQEPDTDQAAIAALQAEATGGLATDDQKTTSKMVIEGKKDTFQRGNEKDTELEQFQKDLDQLAPEVDVESQVYRQVPIADFGAAMLRGMGWTGQVQKGDAGTEEGLPRPSRLGLGATPKLLEAPTHGRRPRRQDQVQRDQRLKQQQEEFEQRKREQVKLDKQRTIQEGSIVSVLRYSSRGEQRSRSEWAIVRKWQGVPGLNMAMVQFEDSDEPEKVKKGDVQLVDRAELQKRPFHEPTSHRKEESVSYIGQKQAIGRDRERVNESHRERDEYRRDRSDRHRPSTSRRDDDHRNHDRGGNRKQSYEDREEKHRKRKRDEGDRRRPSTWLIPNIRVRVITNKLGRDYYKEKGVVVDTTAKGLATLKMANGQILQAPERYLETALPKVGGAGLCPCWKE